MYEWTRKTSTQILYHYALDVGPAVLCVPLKIMMDLFICSYELLYANNFHDIYSGHRGM